MEKGFCFVIDVNAVRNVDNLKPYEEEANQTSRDGATVIFCRSKTEKFVVYWRLQTPSKEYQLSGQ